MAALETVMRIRLLLFAAVLSASPLTGTRAQQGPKVRAYQKRRKHCVN